MNQEDTDNIEMIENTLNLILTANPNNTNNADVFKKVWRGTVKINIICYEYNICKSFRCFNFVPTRYFLNNQSSSVKYGICNRKEKGNIKC